jgi:hypothetical protein
VLLREIRRGSSGTRAEERFAAPLDACAGLAHEADMPNVLAASISREETYRQMFARRFRKVIQGVTMHRPNEPGYSAPSLFVLDDWR